MHDFKSSYTQSPNTNTKSSNVSLPPKHENGHYLNKHT